MNREKLRLRPGDFLVAGVILLTALGLLAALAARAQGKPLTVQVYMNGALVREMSAWTSLTFTVEGTYCNVVSVDYGRVAVVESDCPSQDCVHTGWCSHAGQSIICLPNGVEIRLVGGAPEIDAVAG